MADEYTPPLSPNILWVFKGNEYTPPLSPNIEFIFGADDEGDDNERRKSSYMLLLTM